ncbi:MAG TPA: type II secretion system protein GspM [Methylotenera sp.]|nr:type II secretion system protein GspM [Methylotenera sp.]
MKIADEHLQTAAATLLTLAVLTCLYLLLIKPALDWRHALAERQGDLTFTANKLADNLADANHLNSTLEQLQNDRLLTDSFMSGESEALLAAALQQKLMTLSQQSQASLLSSQLIAASEDARYQKVTLQAHLQTHPGGLAEIIEALHNDQPLLLVENLSIQAQHINETVISEETQANSLLDVRLDISGFKSAKVIE